MGGFLQFYFTKYLEEKRHRRELRVKAYLDFWRCVSRSSTYDFTNKPNDKSELNNQTADAKCRICLYGSDNTIKALAFFERMGSGAATKEQRDSLADLMASMRKDTIGSSSIVSDELQPVLFGLERETQ
jgi:hypothetical protein